MIMHNMTVTCLEYFLGCYAGGKKIWRSITRETKADSIPRWRAQLVSDDRRVNPRLEEQAGCQLPGNTAVINVIIL